MTAAAHVDIAPALTDTQQRVLGVITAYINTHGFPPSRIEIQEAMQFKSPNAVTHVLKVLKKKGRVTIEPNVARGLNVIKRTRRT